MTGRKLYLETFLFSLAVILLEVSYTRVFSYKLVYYFTYLIIGISLLGLGAGGVFVAIFGCLRRMPAARLIPLCAVVGGAAVLGGYFMVALIQLNAFQLVARVTSPGVRAVEVVKLALICTVVFTPFFAAGLALARIFSTAGDRINRLYFTDLVGAAVGCAICIPLIGTIWPPGCVMAAGLLFTLAGVRLAATRSLVVLAPLALGLLAGAAFPSRLPDPIPDGVKSMAPKEAGPPQVLFSRWSPVFRVDVLPTPDPAAVFLSHDGTVGSAMHRFDGGDPAALTNYDTADHSYPFKLLKPAPTVVIIGAAGGNEILAALHFNASHITGVELNPVTYSLLTTHFADYTGHLAENPRVTLINAEGRSFMKRRRERFDLIWFVAPDSYAAMNAATSGAFVLSESYLYTTEMIVDSLEHLAEDGLICTQFGEIDYQHKPKRTLRYLSTAREAFRRLGIEDFDRHVLVGTSPGFHIFTYSTILLKRSPFTESDVARFLDATTKVTGAEVRHAWTRQDSDDPISRVIALPGQDLDRWYEQYLFDVRPVSDDSPFFWHFVRFKDALRGPVEYGVRSPEEGIGERLLLLLLCVAAVFAALFLLAPLLVIRGVWGTIPYKWRAGVYFAALGAGFMFLEVSLIQRLTLFLGYPTYSLTVTLFALLISTGFGSLLSEHFVARRDAAMLTLGALLLVLVAFYERGLNPLVDHAIGWPLAWRVTLAVALLAPLGLCLGVFMPLGLRTVAAVTPHAEEFVAWSWAVNGFFSVVSSVLATILSMTVGFNLVMLAAAAVYLIGIAALRGIPAPGASA